MSEKKLFFIGIPLLVAVLAISWGPLKTLERKHVQEYFDEVPLAWRQKWYSTDPERRGYVELTANKIIRYYESEDHRTEFHINEVLLKKWGETSLEIYTDKGSYWMQSRKNSSLIEFGDYRESENGSPRKARSILFTSESYDY